MIQHCPDCGRDFGGAFAMSRHLDRRADPYRCRTDAELRRRGMHPDVQGVWHRRAPGAETGVLAGMRRSGGSRTVEDRARALRVAKGLSKAERRPPQESTGV